ncbi:MAG: SEC-C domain-containing protein [Bacteroidales bacterium]|nr:SEC-C domain-containing protein [Bacteroidales bacterium]
MLLSIEDIISARSIEEISATLDYFDALPRRYRRKRDLEKALCTYLSGDPRVWLDKLMEYDLKLLQKLCKAGPDSYVDVIPSDFPTVVEALHFVESSKSENDDMLRLTIPRAFYQLIVDEIDDVVARKERDGSFMLEHIILGAVNVYGAVPLRTFVDSIFMDFDNMDEMQGFAAAVAVHPALRIYQEEYRGESFMVSPEVEDFPGLMSDRRKLGKDVRRYAKISLEEIEHCGENTPFNFYGRDTEEGKALLKLFDYLGYEGDELIYSAHSAWLNAQFEPNENNLEILLSSVTAAAEDIEDYSQFREFAEVVINYANSVPKWLLKGQSANSTGLLRYELPPDAFAELFEEDEEAAREQEELMSFFDSVNKVRPVAPDDPCPCGSGISYRFCHGRHFS